ncbi:MAG: hypothetical protein OIF38_16995, partial [Cellvibrionaceae bacterium]|nr:hypothetical protein [Cellvibrionaceae bacterium]
MAEQAGKNKPLDLSSQSDQQGQPVAEVLAQKGQVRIGETTLGDKNLDSNEQAKQTSQAVKEALTVGETVELGKDSAVVARFREGGILVLGQDQTVEISRDLLKRIADARAQGDQAKIQKLEKHLQDLE